MPVIESAYNPMAYSRADAVGLWQFIPSTGRYFNLRQTRFGAVSDRLESDPQ